MPDIDETSGTLVAAEHPSGTLLIGDESAVAEFVARWATESGGTVRPAQLSGSDRASAIAHAAAVGAGGATTVQFVSALRGVPRSEEHTSELQSQPW